MLVASLCRTMDTPPPIWPLSPCPSWWKHKQMLSRKRSEASSITTPRTQTVGEREEEDWGRARGKCRGWTGGKEETNKKRDGVCLLWSLISLFLHASNTCPVEGALPRRREAAGRGRAGVLHEKQPMCRRMLAGYWWGVPAHFCWDKRAVLLLFFDKKRRIRQSLLWLHLLNYHQATTEQFVQTNHSKMNHSKLLSRYMHVSWRVRLVVLLFCVVLLRDYTIYLHWEKKGGGGRDAQKCSSLQDVNHRHEILDESLWGEMTNNPAGCEARGVI